MTLVNAPILTRLITEVEQCLTSGEALAAGLFNLRSALAYQVPRSLRRPLMVQTVCWEIETSDDHADLNSHGLLQLRRYDQAPFQIDPAKSAYERIQLAHLCASLENYLFASRPRIIHQFKKSVVDHVIKLVHEALDRHSGPIAVGYRGDDVSAATFDVVTNVLERSTLDALLETIRQSGARIILGSNPANYARQLGVELPTATTVSFLVGTLTPIVTAQRKAASANFIDDHSNVG
ncbi:hypothetical protein HJC99_05045 [Candidatus Saccharibacteria bacterium]|nr:hypothetical protein [Candidatus Saccharibacteria bacterium]